LIKKVDINRLDGA
jgi:hypothetical protein